MIVYLDASALVKRYIAEAGSKEVGALIAQTTHLGTSLLSRVEVPAALAKAARVGGLTQDEAAAALQVFRSQWPDLICLHPTEAIIIQADVLAWENGLRGYDAAHLASALSWEKSLGEAVTLATYDKQLWRAGQTLGLAVWPETLE